MSRTPTPVSNQSENNDKASPQSPVQSTASPLLSARSQALEVKTEEDLALELEQFENDERNGRVQVKQGFFAGFKELSKQEPVLKAAAKTAEQERVEEEKAAAEQKKQEAEKAAAEQAKQVLQAAAENTSRFLPNGKPRRIKEKEKEERCCLTM